jgi:phosphonate transport system ATP-binding protein
MRTVHSSGPLLALRDVSVRYGAAIALQPTTLEFPDPGFVVLLGPSGAGKSSLLRAVNGLAPASGELFHRGVGLVQGTRTLRAARRRTGMVFQQHQLVRRLSALDNVLHGRLAHHPAWRTLWPLPRAEQALALRCLERVGLGARASARVDRLSGGEQQRVGIARALAQEPRILLADEPVASLDPATSHRLLELLRELAARDGMLALVSLHQVELARTFADRIVALRAGRVVFDGPPAALDPAAVYGRSPARPSPTASNGVHHEA